MTNNINGKKIVIVKVYILLSPRKGSEVLVI